MTTNDPRVIGVDESGKGDFFGPLVIAAFIASDSSLARLESIGVRDSKKIAPKKLLKIDSDLREEFPFALVIISPKKYNQLYDKIKNLNKLLAWGHARAIENLLADNEADSAISDKFGKTELVEKALMEKGRSLKLTQLVRGEAILQVAAASIIARACFVREMEKLSEQYGIEIPKGAAPLVDQAGRKLVENFGVSVLDQVAKKHFKNYGRACDLTLL